MEVKLMSEHTPTEWSAAECIDHATMGTPADDSRTGETPAATAADRRECRSDTPVRGNNPDFGLGVDGGQVAIGDASGSEPNTGGTDESAAANDTITPRTRRARDEEMDVSLLRKGGIYEVRSASDSVYEVDIADGSCTCLDWQRRDPDGGCKHLRRVDMAIKAGTVPRPDGRVPERAITANGDRNTLLAGASRIADRIHALDAAIERQRAERDGLRAALAAIEAFHDPSQSDGEDEWEVE
jgi:hypothetical protein